MYRTAATSAAPDALVFCRACAAEKPVALEAQRHDTFECPACRTDQPVLGGRDDVTAKEIAFISMEQSKYDELEPFVLSLGQKFGCASLVTLRCDGIEIQLGLSINSGTVIGLEMVATATSLPLPSVTFER